MTRSAFLKKYMLKLAIALAMLGVIGHAIGPSANELLTTPIRTVTDSRAVSATAYLFREETVLESPSAGLIDTTVQDGEKVSKNGTVAQVYPSNLPESALQINQQVLEQVNHQLEVLQDSLDLSGTNTGDANDYRAQAQAAYAALCEQAKNGTLSGISALEEEMTVAWNRYLLLSRSGAELERLVANLRRSVSSLEAQKSDLLGSSTPIEVRNGHASGLFYGRGHVDGYESLFTPDLLETLTSEGLAALARRAPAATGIETVGKIVHGYSWYIAMELPRELAETQTVGKQYRVLFSENGDRAVTMTLERLDGTLAIYRADDCPTDFVYYRTQTVQLVSEVQTGYYVPETALYTVSGETGVYVLENSTARFRRVDVIYRGDGYCLAAMGGQIRENDLLITSGGNLYDGKVFE